MLATLLAAASLACSAGSSAPQNPGPGDSAVPPKPGPAINLSRIEPREDEPAAIFVGKGGLRFIFAPVRVDGQ